MSVREVPALSRPFAVTRLPPEGTAVMVEATQAERDALAAEYGLPAVFRLVGDFLVRGQHGQVRVTGRVAAEIEQICVLSLDPFRTSIDEPVDMRFDDTPVSASDVGEDDAGEQEIDPDAPEPIVDGRIDLGHLAAEFLALGIDPYPKKPGATFDGEAADLAASPFAGLAVLKSDD